ncbi:uncharacterized protein LOC127809349 [Diospyros lotus]|uniref:uncharacterized protein LOC127809349 n=1 Tax=Diospyros lotus TaxID=55363 RepID=UPI002255BBA2|nr:uncharacterized protein LOC127809349 [Diospyros lotus]
MAAAMAVPRQAGRPERHNTAMAGSAEDIVDQALLRIKQKLDKYPDGSPIWERQIYLNTLFVGDLKPILVSIGKNHPDTIKLEAYKLKYLRDFVERTNTSVEELLRATQLYFKMVARLNLEGQSDPKVLMERAILDGCFIIELFLKNDKREDGLPFESEQVLYALNRDLILIDNQMSGSVLQILIDVCSLSKKSDQDYDEKLKHFYRMARKFLERIVPDQKLYQPFADIDDQFEDLLSIVYDDLNWPLPHQANSNVEVGDDKWYSVKSATKLEKLGVEFKMIEIDNFVDIKFTHKLLREKMIIDNQSELPNDATIHKFLKDLVKSLALYPNNFSYIQLCMDLDVAPPKITKIPLRANGLTRHVDRLRD